MKPKPPKPTPPPGCQPITPGKAGQSKLPTGIRGGRPVDPFSQKGCFTPNNINGICKKKIQPAPIKNKGSNGVAVLPGITIVVLDVKPGANGAGRGPTPTPTPGAGLGSSAGSSGGADSAGNDGMRKK